MVAWPSNMAVSTISDAQIMENPHQNDSLVKLQSQSALIQSFWHGKLLQKAYKEGKSSPNSLNAVNGEFDNSTRHRETSLSSNVLKLICESFEQLDAAVIPNQECIFTKAEIERLEIWQKMKSVLGKDIITNASNCNYYDAVKRLHPVCQIIHQWLLNLEQHEFEERCKENLEWTGCDNIFVNCFSLLKSSNTADHNLCFLLLTSSLEHALGDVYLSYSDAPLCPSLLKDLLATQELKVVFGDAVISLLHILIGPPSSLNLRNVLWHGFAAPGEVPIQYASLLLVIAASLSNKLKDAPLCLRKVKRPLLKLALCTGERDSIFLSLEPSDMSEIIKLFCASFFIIPSMLPLWLQALDYFCQKRFDLCVVLLLPQLEHGLRRVFACVNNCPHRALTAESAVLYTTFDEILSPVLQDGSENLLKQEIGAGHMEMLLDVLVHPEGPRIRDHISHGEVNMGEISQESANHILCICIAFAGLYIYPDKNNHDGDRPFPVTEKICEAASAYESVFHPISQVKRILHKVALSFLKWHDLPKPLDGEFDSLETNGKNWAEELTDTIKACKEAMASVSLPVDDACKLLPIQFDLDRTNAFVHAVERILDVGPFPTLYRPKREMEVALLLRSIAQHGNVISEQICEAAIVKHQQWKNRQLRQRQRSNYKRLWSQIPFIISALQLMVVVVIIELFQLPKSKEERDRSIFIRFLKRCLQCTENMESLSTMSKNRWDECGTAGKALVKCIEHYYTKHKHEDMDS